MFKSAKKSDITVSEFGTYKLTVNILGGEHNFHGDDKDLLVDTANEYIQTLMKCHNK